MALLTPTQHSILAALATEPEDGNARIRWHSYMFGSPDRAGRGEVLFCPAWTGRLLPAYTLRQMLKQEFIALITPGEPMTNGGRPYRDYELSDLGRRVVARTLRATA